MAERRDITDFVVFVDGTKQAGVVVGFKHPDLAFVVDETNLAGRLGKDKVKLDLDAIGCELTVKDVNRALMGRFGAEVPIIIRAAATDRADVVSKVKVTLRGEVIKVSQGEWKPGEAPSQTYEISLRSYKLEDDGAVVFDIDRETYKLVVDGKDIFAERRSALGLE